MLCVVGVGWYHVMYLLFFCCLDGAVARSLLVRTDGRIGWWVDMNLDGIYQVRDGRGYAWRWAWLRCMEMDMVTERSHRIIAEYRMSMSKDIDRRIYS